MTAYLLVTIYEITDSERFGEYAVRVGATVAAHGGRYLTGKHYLMERLEGDTQAVAKAVMEFDSTEQIHEWYRSDSYRELLRLREGAARVDLFIVQGA